MKKITGLLFLLFMAGCHDEANSDTNGVDCIQTGAPPVIVTITDGESNTVLTEGLAVTAINSDKEVIPFRRNDGKAEFTVSGINTGAYVVQVTKKGYSTFVSEPFVILSGPCGFTTDTIVAYVYPLND